MKSNKPQNREEESFRIRSIILIIAIFLASFFVFDISKIVGYLNSNAGAIQAIFTIILVYITAYYAWQTKKTVDIMQESEKERNRPRLAVFIRQSEDWVNFVYLIIVNYGNDVAKNISFSINTDFELTLSNINLSEVRQIKDGIKNLTPKRELVIPFLNLVKNFEEFKKSNIRITAQYLDVFGNKFEEEFILDITSIVEHQVGQPPIYKISKSLEAISDNIKDIQKKINYEK